MLIRLRLVPLIALCLVAGLSDAEEPETAATCDEEAVGPFNVPQTESSVVCVEQSSPIMIAYGDATSGCMLDSGTDRDRFAFAGVAGERIRFSLRTGTIGLDPFVEIFDTSDPMKDPVAFVTTSCSGSNAFGSFSCTALISDQALPSSGLYIIAVTENGSNETGAYDFQLERLFPIASSTPLNYDEVAAETLAVSTDTDFFDVDVLAGNRVQLFARSGTNGLDPLVEVRRPDGSVLHAESCSGSNSFGSFRCLVFEDLTFDVDGNHTITVADSGKDEVGELEIELHCPRGDCPGVLASSATQIRYGGSTTGCLIDETLDQDILAFDGVAGEGIRILLRTQTNGLDPVLQLFDPSGDEYASASCSGNNSFGSFKCTIELSLLGDDVLPETGSYRIAIRDSGGDEVGGFLLQTERFPPPRPAPSVSLDLDYRDGISPTTDTDFFTFVANAGDPLQLLGRSNTNGLDPSLEIRNPSGEVVLSQSCSGSNAFGSFQCSMPPTNFTPTQSGIHIVSVNDAGRDEVGDFQFSIQCRVLCADEFDRLLDAFDPYEEQFDDTAEFEPALGEPAFEVVAPAGLSVAPVLNVSGPMAAGTGIDASGASEKWILSTTPGKPPLGGELLKGNIPARSDGIGAGPYATFFQNPRNLEGSHLTAIVRANIANDSLAERLEEPLPAVRLEFEVRDANGSSDVLGDFAVLTDTFQSISIPVGGAISVNLSRISGLALVFSSDSATMLPAIDIEVEEVQVVPEPSAIAQGIVACLALGVFGTLRKRGSA